MDVNKKIRVLECIRQGQIGGGESHLLSLAENIDKNKFEPIVLSFTDGPMINNLRDLGVKAHVIYTEKPFDISKWKQVKKLMQEEKIDLVHAHGTRANSNVFKAARDLGLPLVYTIHGWSFHVDQNPLVRTIRTFGEKLLTRKSDINIAVSVSNRKTGIDHIPGFKAVVVNNGIDQRRYNPANNFIDIRQELGISPGEILLLFIARFTTHKQPLSLIRAFGRALEKSPRLKLLMVGEGDEKASALELVEELKIKNAVIFQNFRQDVPDVLAAADIFILPSLWEGLPIGLLEAMSMGKAIIATNVDGTCEVVEDKSNGMLIELSNLETDLAGAIVELAGNAELRKKYSLNAIDTVKNRFNAAVMTREIEEIYLGLLQTKKTIDGI